MLHHASRHIKAAAAAGGGGGGNSAARMHAAAAARQQYSTLITVERARQHCGLWTVAAAISSSVTARRVRLLYKIQTQGCGQIKAVGQGQGVPSLEGSAGVAAGDPSCIMHAPCYDETLSLKVSSSQNYIHQFAGALLRPRPLVLKQTPSRFGAWANRHSR